MPKLITALLVRNEADKYLERVLRRCSEFSHEIIVVDDSSTDGSDQIARDLGCSVFHRGGDAMWGNESLARAELWARGAAAAGDGWLLICDSDMVLHGDPRPLTLSTSVNTWAWVLHDMWDSETTYRADSFWQGHLYPRPWMFRPGTMKEDPIWPRKGMHSGHAPLNYPYVVGQITPETGIYWLHLAYKERIHRLQKHEKYMAQSHQLTDFERAHARSILD